MRLTHDSRLPLGTPPGATLVELVTMVSVLGALLATALPVFHGAQDRLAAEGAASHAVRALTDARQHAVTSSARTAARLDTVASRVIVVSGADTIAVHALGSVYGVRLATTRDSIAWSATGLGYGAANARVIVVRGAAAETVTVSRLGRIRR